MFHISQKTSEGQLNALTKINESSVKKLIEKEIARKDKNHLENFKSFGFTSIIRKNKTKCTQESTALTASE